MNVNRLNTEELELLAAGYVLDDLDSLEKAQVEELIRTSEAMREQIRQSIAVMGVLATNVSEKIPSPSLKDKITQTFEKQKQSSKVIEQSENVSVTSSLKTRINLGNWFQEMFTGGWQTVDDLFTDSTLTPVFRNSAISGGKKIAIGENITIILMVRITQSSLSKRDVIIEILPTSSQIYLPRLLQTKIIDAEGFAVIEATTRDDTKNIEFDFSGQTGEAFSVQLLCGDRAIQENFII